jgi:hypothetical protein
MEMNIEELADQADLASPWRPMSKLQLLQLKKFAELVAAHEREKYAKMVGHISKFAELVAAHEREKCAKLCEKQKIYGPLCETPYDCAAAIRARSQA